MDGYNLPTMLGNTSVANIGETSETSNVPSVPCILLGRPIYHKAVDRLLYVSLRVLQNRHS